jgi:hypothetical protein
MKRKLINELFSEKKYKQAPKRKAISVSNYRTKTLPKSVKNKKATTKKTTKPIVLDLYSRKTTLYKQWLVHGDVVFEMHNQKAFWRAFYDDDNTNKVEEDLIGIKPTAANGLWSFTLGCAVLEEPRYKDTKEGILKIKTAFHKIAKKKNAGIYYSEPKEISLIPTKQNNLASRLNLIDE